MTAFPIRAVASRAPLLRSRLSSVRLLDILSFVAPLLCFVQVDAIGHLYLTDIVLAAALPFLLIRHGRRLLARPAFSAILLLALWSFGQVATDLVRHSSPRDFTRGWAMLAFATLNFSTIFLMTERRPARLVLFAAGIAIGQILTYLLAPSAYAAGDPWKFGYGAALTWLSVLLAVSVSGRRGFGWLAPCLVMLIAAVANMYAGFRSLAGVAFLTSCFLIAQGLRPKVLAVGKRPALRRLIAVGVVGICGGWGTFQLYQYAAQTGWLGQIALQKYEAQSSGHYGLLVGGRSEILVSSQAILDSPLLGHGSWAKDCRYTSLYSQLRQQLGYFPGEENEDCLIPAHSHLLGAWVQAGILGAIFWLWALTLPIRALGELFGSRERLAPLVAFVAFFLLWDIFFSPFAGDRRFLTPYYLVVLMSFLPLKIKTRRRRLGGRHPAVAVPGLVR